MWSFLAPAPDPGLEPGPLPTFSVVIATYQAADTIGAAVRSALDQTLPPHEVIVVDDGSTDGIDGALAHLADRIVFVRKENGGGASALNVAIGVATGDFVSILDADDVYEPRRIEALGDLAKMRPDLDVLVTDSYLEADGTIRGRFSDWTPFAVDDQRAAIFSRCFVPWPAVRRSRIEASGSYDEAFRIAYDWDCYLRLILAGARAGMVDVPLHRYRLGNTSLSGDRPAALRERVLLLEKATNNPHLRPSDRETLQRALAASRRRALLVEAETALRSGAGDSRQRSLAVALGPGFGLRARAKALLAAVAPRAASRRLDAMEASTGWSRLQRGRPRD